METKLGRIKAIKESTGRGPKGIWKRFEYEFEDGMKYSTFNENIGLKFKPGQYVRMTGNKNAKGYWNMETMEFAEEDKEQVQLPEPSNETNDLLRQILAVLKDGTQQRKEN